MLKTDDKLITYNEAEQRLRDIPCGVWADVVPPGANYTHKEFFSKWSDYKVMLWGLGFDYDLSDDGTKIRKRKININVK